MDRIDIARVGKKIAISLRREVGQLARVRYITPEDALGLGMLLTSESADQALNFNVSAGVSLQIETPPYDRVWLSFDGRDGGSRLVACVEGAVIRKVGRCLHRICRTVLNSRRSKPKTHSYPVSYCYLDNA